MDGWYDYRISVSSKMTTSFLEREELRNMSDTFFPPTCSFWINSDNSFLSFTSFGSNFQCIDRLFFISSLNWDVSEGDYTHSEHRITEKRLFSNVVNRLAEESKVSFNIQSTTMRTHQNNWLVVIEFLFELHYIDNALDVKDPAVKIYREPVAGWS